MRSDRLLVHAALSDSGSRESFIGSEARSTDRGVQRAETGNGIGFAGGAHECPGYPGLDIVAGLTAKMAEGKTVCDVAVTTGTFGQNRAAR